MQWQGLYTTGPNYIWSLEYDFNVLTFAYLFYLTPTLPNTYFTLYQGGAKII